MTKRIRLPGGKWISRRLPESTPLRLQGAKPADVWDMGQGRRILVVDMDTKHLINAIKFVEELAKRQLQNAGMEGKFDPRVFVFRALAEEYPSFPTMVKELERRLAPKPETPKHARTFTFE